MNDYFCLYEIDILFKMEMYGLWVFGGRNLCVDVGKYFKCLMFEMNIEIKFMKLFCKIDNKIYICYSYVVSLE